MADSTTKVEGDGLRNKFNLDLFKFDAETKRKNLIFLARTAEAAERYDDMCLCMRDLVQGFKEADTGKTDLSIDERNLLSVAYKNVIGARRASWRTLNAESQDEKNEPLITKYKKQVEAELQAICNNVLNLLNTYLIDESKQTIHIKEDTSKDTTELDNADKTDKQNKQDNATGEAQVFYLKMAGDYYRYLSEAVTSTKTEESSSDFYKRAFELSEKVLEPTHPIRLGLALNYSVCFYEILKDKKKACQLAKDAFDEAISKLDKLEESDYKDSTLIMQLLRDNLTLWTSSDNDDASTTATKPDNTGGDGGGD